MLPPMRILVIEDDPKIASFIVNGLKQSGFAVDHCSDGEDGYARAQTTTGRALIAYPMNGQHRWAVAQTSHAAPAIGRGPWPD